MSSASVRRELGTARAAAFAVAASRRRSPQFAGERPAKGVPRPEFGKGAYPTGHGHPTAGQGYGRWGISELVVAVRWGALSLSLVGMGFGAVTSTERGAAATLAVAAVLRTVWPLRVDEPLSRRYRWRTRAAVAAELALCSVVVAFTGTVGSPFVISLGASAFIFGLVMAPWLLGGVAVTGIIAIAVAGVEGALSRTAATRVVEQLAVLGAVAMLGSYSQWLVRAGRESQGEQVERLRNLTEVNHLLLELHAKAASLPASLNLRGAVANTVSRLRALLSPDVVALILNDPVTNEGDVWEVSLAEGVALPLTLATEQLAPALHEAMSSVGPVCRSHLEPGEGVAMDASTGLYVPMWARDYLVGMLAIERVDGAAPFEGADAEMVAGVARHAGLAIDNARWFRRLRTLGADEERGRIARELHDRVGQSLAYVAVSMDRLAAEVASGTNREGTGAELEDLAVEVRGAARYIRTKLSDLRAEGGDGDVVAALAGLLARVEQRSGIATTLVSRGDGPLLPVVGREITRIAEEAISNAERHSRAGYLRVRWACNGKGAELDVHDDGDGMSSTAQLRPDAFGILGMRERADAIGASIAIKSSPGQGTTVTLRWGHGASAVNGR
ncbi:MAG: GAF domain-containing sensor histidine kinase [Acidimicrobiales bacterium]